jgi:hypothetical protein
MPAGLTARCFNEVGEEVMKKTGLFVVLVLLVGLKAAPVMADVAAITFTDPRCAASPVVQGGEG